MMAVRSRIPETKQTWKYFCSTSDWRQVQKKRSAVKKKPCQAGAAALLTKRISSLEENNSHREENT